MDNCIFINFIFAAIILELKRTVLLFLSFLQVLLLLAQQDTLYFDKNWKKCGHDEAVFFRTLFYSGGLYHATDHYLDGRPQMQGNYKALAPVEIPEGKFEYFAHNGVRTRLEYFSNGLNEGEYLSYDSNAHLLLKMNFKNDKWDGHRIEYYPSGVIRRDEVYSAGIFVTGECFDQLGRLVKFFPLEELPSFPGGEAKLMEFVRDHLKYPDEAVKAGIEGKVKVKFIIDTTGLVSDITVHSSDNPMLDPAALDVVRQLPRFSPARQEGAAVRFQYLLPLVFRLTDSKK